MRVKLWRQIKNLHPNLNHDIGKFSWFHGFYNKHLDAEKRREEGLILSLPDTLNENYKLSRQFDNLIAKKIESQEEISLEDLTGCPARIWYALHMNGDRSVDSKW